MADDTREIEAADLWSNEFDLSLFADKEINVNVTGSLSDYVKNLAARIVVNDTHDLHRIWSSRLSDGQLDAVKNPHTVALVTDNAGPELVADLCLAEYLIQSGFTSRVVFYPKAIPWYVSDVTANDITWLLDEGLSAKFLAAPLVPLARKWAEKWRARFSNGHFIVRESPFWTYSCPYGEMAKVNPKLYEELTTGVDVILFKGDLNYRKILADRTWRPDCVKQKQAAFRGMQFGRPTDSTGRLTCSCSPSASPGFPVDCRCPMKTSQNWPPLLCALRIAKADVAVGLTPETLSRVRAESNDWWIIGRYGIIQIVSPIQL
ncbi:unnamed protein product [Echinostoma caproni]|uniref:Sugar phosphate phosphatase n=1 Tax=Echinostoma caproni TaxID=27848 RepID=A0A183B0Q6_9TREM|nr:unnamed protein product [Echinostoma caproni]